MKNYLFSANGGVSVHADEPEICEIMAQVGSQLNLKEHTVGITESTKNLYTPVDLEVHKIKDGRYAVCDFARLFPPEYPESKKKGAFLYKMLRPELVKTNRISLSSDGISKFGHHERENDEEIKEATRNLIDFRIPNFAYSFSRKFKHSNIQPMSLLVHELHRAGINCRFKLKYLKTFRNFNFQF